MKDRVPKKETRAPAEAGSGLEKGAPYLPHEHEWKRFPNGIKGLLRCIRMYFRVDVKVEKGARSVPQFVKNQLLRTYNKILLQNGQPQLDGDEGENALVDLVRRLEGRKEKDQEVTFNHLRAYATCIRLPTGLALAYSQLITFEAQGRSRDELSQFISDCTRAMLALKDFYPESKSEAVFHKVIIEKGEPTIIGIPDGLKRMSDAFNARDKHETPS